MQEVLSVAPSDSELESRARSILRWKIRFNAVHARQLALTTMALSGLSTRKNWSTASDLRRGFHENQISEPSTRMVGRKSAKLRLDSVCASSHQAML